MQENWINKLITEEETNVLSSALPKINEEDCLQSCLCDLKSLFQEYVDIFNEVKKENMSSIHIYKVAESKEGFLLFRKGCRLIFSKASPTQIQIQLLKKEQEELISCVSTHLDMFFSNPFISPQWVHKEWPGFVNLKILTRYYMEMFIRQSFSD